jgi:UDP-N-acetylmuramoylalanine--D-glutamate ligase
VVFGHVADKIVETVHQLVRREHPLTKVETLTEAVEVAAAVAQAGDVVLLSPGGTSYDAYVDFAQRGEHFRQLVMQL